MSKIHMIRALILIIAVAGLLGVSAVSGTASTTLNVSIYCIALGHARLECHATVSGGTGGYTYTWTPTPITGSQDFVIVPCARAYRNQTVSLTVTDGSGATGSDSTVRYCGDAE